MLRQAIACNVPQQCHMVVTVKVLVNRMSAEHTHESTAQQHAGAAHSQCLGVPVGCLPC